MIANYTAPELVLILTAVTALVVQSITAWRTSQKVDLTSQKVDKVTTALAENTIISTALQGHVKHTSHKVEQVSAQIAENTGMSTVLQGQVAEVHELTNSNLAAVKADLAIAMERVTSLVAMVEGLKAERRERQGR